MALVRHVLSSIGIEAERLTLQWASAAEAVRFVDLITTFVSKVHDLGPLPRNAATMIKMNAARPALAEAPLRMALARRIRSLRSEQPLPAIPADQEIVEGIGTIVSKQLALHELVLHLRKEPLTVEECAKRLNRPQEDVVEMFSRLKKRRLVEADRLILPGEFDREAKTGESTG